jgi:hypothetical protein
MAKPISQGMKTKDFIASATKAGFRIVKEKTGERRTKLHISHPLLQDALEGLTPTHGVVNGHFVKYAIRNLRALEELAKDTQAPPSPAPKAPEKPDYAVPASPDAARYREEGKKMEEARAVQQAADTLATWLDDRAKEGLRQFPLAMINNKMRAKLSLPDAELTMSALSTLVRRNILGEGKQTRGDRQYRAYRINPALLSNGGPGIVEAYDSDGWKSLPQAPAFDEALPMEVKAKPKPATKPVPKPIPSTPTPSAQGDFKSALIQDAMQDQDLVMTVVDMYITNQQFEKLAQLLIGSTDVEWCERVLKRVAEIAPRSE